MLLKLRDEDLRLFALLLQLLQIHSLAQLELVVLPQSQFLRLFSFKLRLEIRQHGIPEATNHKSNDQGIQPQARHQWPHGGIFGIEVAELLLDVLLPCGKVKARILFGHHTAPLPRHTSGRSHLGGRCCILLHFAGTHQTEAHIEVRYPTLVARPQSHSASRNLHQVRLG